MVSIANLHVALVLDCLLANDVETLGSDCLQPQWRVAKDDLCEWLDLSSQPTVRQCQSYSGAFNSWSK